MLSIVLMHISHFIFFANDLFLAVYFIFILHYWNAVRQKSKFEQCVFIWIQMGCKTLETTHNINNTFGPGTTNKHTVQWWFKKFCKGEERLEDKEHSGWPSEVDNDQLRAMIKADPLTTTRGVAEELNVSHSTLIWYLKQIEKVEKLHKWVHHELTKNCHFEVSSLILHNNNEPFLDWIVTYDEKWILYDNQWCPPQWWNWAKAPKHFPEPNFHQKKKKKKIMVTVQWSAASLSHYSFLNPSKTIISEKYAQQINEMHQKLQCLQPALVNRMVPILLHDNAWPHITQPTLQKLNELGYEVLPYPPCSPDLTPTHYPFFKHLDNFLQRKHFHNQQEAENPFQELFKSWSSYFYATGINKHFSLAKMCWL